MYAIKAKGKTEKRWAFLRPDGSETQLKIHAAQLRKEQAEEICSSLRTLNPEFDFKIVNF
jgi:demethoxyubiquinone hydroxylase (CLK1/Coq7/Cat5 family)